MIDQSEYQTFILENGEQCDGGLTAIYTKVEMIIPGERGKGFRSISPLEQGRYISSEILQNFASEAIALNKTGYRIRLTLQPTCFKFKLPDLAHRVAITLETKREEPTTDFEEDSSPEAH